MKLTSGGKFVNFRRGETLIEANKTIDGLMTESKGLTRVYFVDQNGKEIPVAAINSLWEVSAMKMLGVGANLAVEAVTNGDMRVWGEAESKEYLKKDGAVLAESMTKVMQFTAILLTGNARQKVAAVVKEAGEKGVDSGLAHKIIAGMTGLTRETVTLQMIKLEKEGVIDNRNRMVRIVHPEKLQEIING